MPRWNEASVLESGTQIWYGSLVCVFLNHLHPPQFFASLGGSSFFSTSPPTFWYLHPPISKLSYAAILEGNDLPFPNEFD